ncbi:MAG: hypothetical protein O2960_25305 [Verrucomicrobia bacterium]|nr:hypothetical protein [Verrucomicrobiota bacterium]
MTTGRTAEITQSARQSENAEAGELNQLVKARYEIAASLLEFQEKRLNEGKGTLINVFEAAGRVRDSAMELTGEPAVRLAALSNYLAVTRRLEDSINRLVEKGVVPSSDRDLARYLRLEAQIALLRINPHGDRERKTKESEGT